MPSKAGVCFPHSCGSLIIKSCWSSRSDFLGIPRPFVRSPCWEVWCEVPNLHNIGRTSLLLLFSNLWVTHLASMRFDFITVVPLLPSHCNFFVFGCGVSFLVGFSVLLLMVVQQLLVLLQKEMSAHPSTLPSWTYILHSNMRKTCILSSLQYHCKRLEGIHSQCAKWESSSCNWTSWLQLSCRKIVAQPRQQHLTLGASLFCLLLINWVTNGQKSLFISLKGFNNEGEKPCNQKIREWVQKIDVGYQRIFWVKIKDLFP